jgi:hypothetical protein
MKRLLPLLLALLLQACATPSMLPAAPDQKAGSGEVVVIGKIELVPPISPLEQQTHWNVIGEKRMLGHVFMATGESYKPVTTGRIDGAEFQATLEAEWGTPFMVKVARQPRTYFNGGMTHLNVMRQEMLWFPGGLYFEVPQGATAVYIGTLRYHRNDFNSITRVEIVDERKDIPLVLKTGGSPAEVRSALLKKLR